MFYIRAILFRKYKMQYKLYRYKEGNKSLILFFNGWAMTPETIEHLAFNQDNDLLVLWDYRSSKFNLDLSAYEEIYLLAWSMGVWAADRWYHKLKVKPLIKEAIAICGTGYPMSDERGIPQMIFEGTLESLSEENRLRFNRRMCGGKRLKHLFEALQKRSTEEIKGELQSVYEEELRRLETEELKKQETAPWTKAIIGLKDRIIPPENQQRYWKEQAVSILPLAEEDHYMFTFIKSWEELWQ